jgi:cyanobactin biosynthesis protein (PatB/AcyB/McaB family)
MKLPKQSAPVNRPDIIHPHTVLDLTHGTNDDEEIKNLKFDLLIGANYNAPAVFSMSVSPCGCHIFSGNSMSTCRTKCGMV